MDVDAFAASDRGRRRESNEDQYLIDESIGLYVVCDGMGGHAAGEVAAERSVAFVAEYIRERVDLLEKAGSLPDGHFRVLKLAEDAIHAASRRLYEQACSESSLAGMGTTLTMLLIVEGKAVMAHVGDSRLYVLRRGELHQLSTDHTLANELLQAGGLTPEQAAVSRYNHVLTRTVGRQEMVQVESLLFDLFPEDTCLLCSDGLSNYFKDRTVVAEYLASGDLSGVPGRLVEFANSRGGADNITAVVLRVASDSNNTHAAEFRRRIETLKSTFLCNNLSMNRLMRVMNIASMIDCAAGQQLLPAGHTCDGLYVVLEGILTIKGESEALGPGDFFGETSLLHAGKIYASLVAQEPSRLLFIPRSRFGKLTRRLPKLGNVLLTNLSRHLSERLARARSLDDTSLADTAIWEREPD